ncbi:MAG: YfcE family phosphodiesterase [Bacillota bacterium]|nr:YfcE family phosphodiesterase [Bacillota bacterium]
MYRIVIISDTHRHIDYVVRLLDNIREFDMIVHLGDHSSDAKKIAEMYPLAKVLAVQGNNDLPSLFAPKEIICDIENIRFFITHGHNYGVKYGYERICYRAKEESARVLLFGHTHVPLCEREEDLLILNPGGYNSAGPSVGIVEIENGRAKGCLYPC